MNAKNIIDASPYPAALLPCVDAPGGAITSSPHSQLNKAERSLFQSHLRAIADWSAEALRGVVLRHEAGNLLDSLVTWLPQLRLQAEFEAAGAARAEEQLALLVRSFHACGA